MSKEKIAELEVKLEEALSTINEQRAELEKAQESDVQWQQRLDNAQAELEAADTACRGRQTPCVGKGQR